VEAEAEEHRAEEGQDEDVDVVTIDDEPEVVDAEEVQPNPVETQVMLLTPRTFFQQHWDDTMCNQRDKEPCCDACLSMLGRPYVSQLSMTCMLSCCRYQTSRFKTIPSPWPLYWTILCLSALCLLRAVLEFVSICRRRLQVRSPQSCKARGRSIQAEKKAAEDAGPLNPLCGWPSVASVLSQQFLTSCGMQEKTAAEEAKAAAEPEAEAEKAEAEQPEEKAAQGTGPKQSSAGPSPAVSGSTPTTPTDAPATSSQQDKPKPKVSARTTMLCASVVLEARDTMTVATPHVCSKKSSSRAVPAFPQQS